MSATAAQTAFDELSNTERKEFLDANSSQLPTPPSNGRTVIWIIVLSTLAVAMILFGLLGFAQLRSDSGAGTEVLFGLATSALGAIAGLLIPSPVQPSNQ
jgi:hypothetical protein